MLPHCGSILLLRMPKGRMDSKEFVKARHYLGKTQNQLARLLCLSPKAVQSFEQGWRKIPSSAERQLLFLVSCKRSESSKTGPCWETRDCPAEWRDKCAAWEFKAGYFCWFITGTFCGGDVYDNWEEKIKQCRQCEVYNLMLPEI
jgi:hypothetical protein